MRSPLSHSAIPGLDFATPFIRQDLWPFRNRKVVAPLALKHEYPWCMAAAYSVSCANTEISTSLTRKMRLLAHFIDSAFTIGNVSSATICRTNVSIYSRGSAIS
jgi:hypothetical protein